MSNQNIIVFNLTEGQNSGLRALNPTAVCWPNAGDIDSVWQIPEPNPARKKKTELKTIINIQRGFGAHQKVDITYWHCESHSLLLQSLQDFILPFSETATDPTTTKSTRAFPSRPTGTLYSFMPCKKKIILGLQSADF